jgi:hypothetical protein
VAAADGLQAGDELVHRHRLRVTHGAILPREGRARGIAAPGRPFVVPQLAGVRPLRDLLRQADEGVEFVPAVVEGDGVALARLLEGEPVRLARAPVGLELGLLLRLLHHLPNIPPGQPPAG